MNKDKINLSELLEDDKVEEYRSLPFWSWNDKLEPDELVEQIHWMKKQGFGGYFMHARGGLKTEYLSDDWFECIGRCLIEGNKIGMKSWAYDENGWPSGFVGGKLLEDINNRDCYLTYSIGKFDEKAFVSYSLNYDKLLRIKEQTTDDCLNVYKHVSASTVDILNYDVVSKFIEETHEKYKEKFKDNFSKLLCGFFTDEPQYYRFKHPYTNVLEDYFRTEYKEDLLDGLGLMFVEKAGYRSFRYKYWKAMQTLMLKNYAEHVYEWCNKNGIEFTGHYIEETMLKHQMTCCAGIMPFYEYEHIPGIDKLKRYVDTPIAAKQVSSVARQLGKKRIITETFAMCGWDVTPKELKLITEAQFVNGVNLLCHHLIPYSEHGQRKRDYPAHYSWANPWVNHDFKTFNDYFARLGCLLGESEEVVDVAVFVPLRSIYFDYKRENYEKWQSEIDASYIGLVERLSQLNIPYHLIDETILAKYGSVKGNKLQIGKCEYSYILFPKTLTMDATSEKLFNEFFENDGKFLFTEGIPEYLEGDIHEYKLKSNVTLDEILKNQPYHITSTETPIQSTYREYNGKKFIFAVNTDLKNSYTVSFEGDFKELISVGLEKFTQETLSLPIKFEPGQSYLLFFTEETGQSKQDKKELILNAPYKVSKSSGNYFTLDKARYSFDGKRFSEKLNCMGIFNELLKKRYCGELYLRYEFEVEEIPKKIKFFAENMNNISCEINGKKISFDLTSDFEKKLYGAEISKQVVRGLNVAVIKINFYENQKIYDVLFGKNITESLKNCLTYDTTIEACYLQGEFGVYSRGGFKEGQEKNVLIADDDFYIGKPKREISDLCKDGYPFFAGEITLQKKFVSDGSPCILKIPGRYQLCELKINGAYVEKSYFGNEADISRHIKKGENSAEFILFSSNRNLLGPHHYALKEEPFDVTPKVFELPDTWVDGKSSLERDDYSFVKFGLNNNLSEENND